MSRHASSALLSAYLDEELDGEELARVEQHLEDCGPCRQEMVGLRSVVTALRGLERQAPSQVLGQAVVRRVALRGHPTGWMERLEGRLEKLRLDSSPFVTFALVLAFAVIIVALAGSIEKSNESTRLVVLPTIQAEVDEVTLGERTFERRDGAWIARGSVREVARVVSCRTDEGEDLRSGIEGIDRLLVDSPVVFDLESGETIELRLFDDQSP